MFCADDMFYSEAMKLYQKAGHAVVSLPIYINHTYKQVVYFDSEKTCLIDPLMSKSIKFALDISHLFDLGDDVFEIETGSQISYYSIVLGCEKKNRSQTAHDIHCLLQSTFSAELSVIIFKHEESILISISGVNTDVVLSDWYDYASDYDNLVERIPVVELSLESPDDFINDLIYLIARDYYKHPVPGRVDFYSLIPAHYFCADLCLGDSFVDREPLKDLIKRLVCEDQQCYGDDYVELASKPVRNLEDIDTQLDMLSFELDLEEEIQDDIGEEDAGTFDNGERDEYEYENIDSEIFDDPSLMLKWLDSEE